MEDIACSVFKHEVNTGLDGLIRCHGTHKDLGLYTLTQRVTDENLDKLLLPSGKLADFVDARVHKTFQ